MALAFGKSLGLKSIRNMRGADWLLALVVIAVLIVSVLVRVRYLSVPFERDEGEYAYAAQLILAGLPPYAEAYNMKMPGIYYAYALVIAALGDSHTAIHFGLLVINLVTSLGVFLLARWLAGTASGAMAAAVFAVLTLGREASGVFANAEHFVLPFVVFGLLFLVRGLELASRRRLIASGVLLGLAFLMKQHAVAYAGLAAALIVLHGATQRDWRGLIRNAGIVGVAAAAPLIFLIAGMYAVGMARQFFFWTFDYAAAYVNVVPPERALGYFLGELLPIAEAAWPIWLLAALGGVLWPLEKVGVLRRALVPLGLVFGLLATVPGFYFRNHYFLLPMPMVAVAFATCLRQIGIACGRLSGTSWAKAISVAVFAVAIVVALWGQRAYLVTMTPLQMSRVSYGLNPFPESLAVADYIDRNSTPEDRIAVIGSEPQIYFYARRRAATGYIYMYPLMEPQPYAPAMQRQMIAEVSAKAPRFIVLVGVRSSWLPHPTSDMTILQWSQQYIADHYQQVGVVDIMPYGTHFVWDAAAEGYWPQSDIWLRIYRRRE